jgi:hypothetical protein
MRGDGGVELYVLATVTLKYDEVAFRSVQNSPAVVGSVPGSERFSNPEFMRL